MFNYDVQQATACLAIESQGNACHFCAPMIGSPADNPSLPPTRDFIPFSPETADLVFDYVSMGGCPANFPPEKPTNLVISLKIENLNIQSISYVALVLLPGDYPPPKPIKLAATQGIENQGTFAILYAPMLGTPTDIPPPQPTRFIPSLS